MYMERVGTARAGSAGALGFGSIYPEFSDLHVFAPVCKFSSLSLLLAVEQLVAIDRDAKSPG